MTIRRRVGRDWGYIYEWCDSSGKKTRRIPRTPAEWKRWGARMRKVEAANARQRATPALVCRKARRRK